MNIIKYLKRIWCKEETNYTPKSPDPELTLKVIKNYLDKPLPGILCKISKIFS